jgi:hypothetical protein
MHELEEVIAGVRYSTAKARKVFEHQTGFHRTAPRVLVVLFQTRAGKFFIAVESPREGSYFHPVVGMVRGKCQKIVPVRPDEARLWAVGHGMPASEVTQIFGDSD